MSKISLVDLAGSERAKDTGAEGKRLQVRERERLIKERGRESREKGRGREAGGTGESGEG